jgi:TRAP-type C4-dicarboxylate transport system permease small subunit
MNKTPSYLKDSLSNIQKGIFSASRVSAYIAMVLLVLLVLLTVADVVMRRFFNAPIAITMDISKLTLGTIVFLSLAYCAVHGSHIVVDLIVSRFSQRTQSIIGTVIYMLSVVLMGILSWRLFLLAIRVKDMGETTVIWDIPTYPFVFLAALGSTLLTLVFLVQFFYIMRGVRKQ